MRSKYRSFGAFMVLAALLVGLMPLVALGNGQSNTCKDQLGFSENLETGTSGDWGSVDFTPDDGVLTLTVEEGFEVSLCIKKGNVNPAITEFLGEGVHIFDVSDFSEFPGQDGDGFSHYSLIIRTVDVELDCDDEEYAEANPQECDTTTTTVEETTTTTVVEETTTTVGESTTTVPTTTESTLPFTGIEDYYLPAAIAMVLAGGLLLALSRRPESN